MMILHQSPSNGFYVSVVIVEFLRHKILRHLMASIEQKKTKTKNERLNDRKAFHYFFLVDQGLLIAEDDETHSTTCCC